MKISSYSTILVDFFDTVMSRKSSPSQVLRLWAWQISKLFLYKIQSSDIFDLRMSAEKHLSKVYGDDYCIYTYTELIETMATSIKSLYKIEDKLIEIFKYKSQSIEEDLEKQNLYPNWDVIDILIEEKKRGKKIFCVSDFYLGKESLEKFFSITGIDLFDAYYVSCDYKKSKSSSNLYLEVINNEQLVVSKTVMIGDNYQSDYVNAKKCGLDARNLNRTTTFKKYKKYDKNRNRIIKRTLDKIYCDNNKKYMYTNYIFSLTIFIEKLYLKLISENKKHVIFLSREGEFMKKLFDEFQNDLEEKIATHYLKISRNSALMVNIDKYGFSIDSVYKNINSKTMNLEELLKSLTFNESEIKSIEGSFNIKSMVDNNLINKLLKNQKFVTLLNAKTENQYDIFMEYFNTFSIDEEIVNIVDVGWNGSMQNMLSEILECKVDGFYLGLTAKAHISLSSRKFGILFEEYPRHFGDFYSYRHLYYEQILKASHARINSYKSKNEVLYDENDNADSYYKYIFKLQERMFEKFKKIMAAEQNMGFLIAEYEHLVKNFHSKMFASSTYSDYICIHESEKIHVNGFGTDNTPVTLSKKKFLREKLSAMKFRLKYLIGLV